MACQIVGYSFRIGDYVSQIYGSWSGVCTASVKYAEMMNYKVMSLVRSTSQEQCEKNGGVTICNMITPNGNESCIAVAIYGT